MVKIDFRKAINFEVVYEIWSSHGRWMLRSRSSGMWSHVVWQIGVNTSEEPESWSNQWELFSFQGQKMGKGWKVHWSNLLKYDQWWSASKFQKYFQHLEELRYQLLTIHGRSDAMQTEVHNAEKTCVSTGILSETSERIAKYLPERKVSNILCGEKRNTHFKPNAVFSVSLTVFDIIKQKKGNAPQLYAHLLPLWMTSSVSAE
jgi:hypothetical protein